MRADNNLEIMEENKRKIQLLVDEAKELIDQKVTCHSAEFKVWISRLIYALINIYGEDSVECRQIRGISFQSMRIAGVTHAEAVRKCEWGLKCSIGILGEYMENMSSINKSEQGEKMCRTDFSKVFIVHGHDEALKHAVARLIEKQGIEAVILSEQRNGGDTIITKFEKNSDVGAAIFLFTVDDLGKAKDEIDLKPRARQNVVFEAGYFMGKLGRERTIMISDKGVEIPSDMQGIVYTDSANWQLDVLRELEGIGYKIDYNKQFGMSR